MSMQNPAPGTQSPTPSSRGLPWWDYARLMRIDRPIGSLLLLWPTLWALWIASSGQPRLDLLTVFVVGVFVMRSAGCVINDLSDEKLDAQVARTLDRPLPSGRVSRREAWVLFFVLMTIALGLASLLNPLALALAVPGAILAATYPLMKRVTYLPQAYLGVAFGWGIPMAFAAELGTIPLIGWVLLAANIVWAIAYDTMYAMADREDDIKAGARSSAILFGAADRAFVVGFHLATLGLLTVVGVLGDASAWYYAGLVVAAGFALYQRYLIHERVAVRCFAAFLNNNWFGGAVFAGLWLHYLLASSA